MAASNITFLISFVKMGQLAQTFKGNHAYIVTVS